MKNISEFFIGVFTVLTVQYLSFAFMSSEWGPWNWSEAGRIAFSFVAGGVIGLFFAQHTQEETTI